MMVLIAGQVAGRRGRGLRRARLSATIGVARGSGITLGALLLLGVISMQPRVVVPVGGMIVSAAMLATGITLRRLQEDTRTLVQPSRPGCAWDFRLERRFCRTVGPPFTPR